MANYVGLDIGGANLKIADSDGSCRQIPFPLWKQPRQLRDELANLLDPYSRETRIGVTMTGELADCFTSSRVGVSAIIDAMQIAANGRSTHFWQTVGEFVEAEIAKEFWQLTAAANWHALATWAARAAPQGAALVIDMGSTTTDIIPTFHGLPMPSGRTDLERLRSHELLYFGISRTPICALVSELPVHGSMIPVAAEFFATTQDALLLTGKLPEDASDTGTADGRPATIEHAQRRLARCVCLDNEQLPLESALEIARHVEQTMSSRLASGLERVLSNMNQHPETVLLSGSGAFLVDQVIDQSKLLGSSSITRLDKLVSPSASRCACAYAVMRLMSEFAP